MDQFGPADRDATSRADDQIVARHAAQFAAAWRDEQRPTIESYLNQSTSDAHPRLLLELVKIEVAHRRQAGEEPAVDEYLARFPEHRARLEGFFAALNLDGQRPNEVGLHATIGHVDSGDASIDGIGGHSRLGGHGLKVRCPHCHNPIELVDSDSLQELTCPSCGSSFSLVEGQSTSTYAQPTVKQLGHFELVERLGMGAFGTVWKARDTELDRIVAIKIPRADRLAPEEIEKFFREARAAAQLRHPSIVSVHEVGRDGDTVYIVSDLVRGVTLSDWLSGQQLTPREAAELCAQIADALHHAHEQGVIHRDLKPGNIMLDADGRPHLMDFGLAKREAGEITMTVEGQVLGTPAYMSPEQARGEGHAVDRRADVYSLGVILFQLLTGELPFRGTPRMLLHQVLNEEPRSPRSLNDRIPRDLETICLKAMQKKPGKRYERADQFANDLRRFLHGEPISARPVGRIERSWRWCKRNPIVAGLTAAVVAAVFIGTSATAFYAAASAQSANDARQSQQVAEKRAAEAHLQRNAAARQQEQVERLLYVSMIARAQDSWEIGNVGMAWKWLKAGREDLRGWEYDYLHNQFTRGQKTLEGKQLDGIAFSPDGSLIATGEHGRLLLWEVKTGRVTFTEGGHNGRIRSVAFSPDGTRIVSGDSFGAVSIWDVATGKIVQDLKGHSDEVTSVAFSPNNAQIGSASRDNATVKLWDVQSGKELLTLNADKYFVSSIAFSPDGARIASSGYENLKLWDTATGELALTIKTPAGCAAFSPDGARLTSGNRVWDSSTGQETLRLMPLKRYVNTRAFSPDGKLILSDAYSATLTLWDSSTGELIRTFKGHKDTVSGAAFSPDGQKIASVSSDGEAKLWDIASSQDTLTLNSHDGQVLGVAFSPDGRRIASAGTRGTVKLWDSVTGELVLSFTGHPGLASSVSFSPDGKRIASGGNDTAVKVWDTATGKRLLLLKGHTENSSVTVAFSPDGQRIASGDWGGVVRVWDATTGRETVTLKEYSGQVTSIAFSPDGESIAATGGSGGLKLWNAATGKVVLTIEDARSVAFSSDGARIAGRTGGTMKIWDARTGLEIPSFKGVDESGASVVFSPNGARIATAGDDGTVKFYDAETGIETLTLRGHSDRVNSLAFSPDGKRLASAGDDGTVMVWDAGTSKETVAIESDKK